MPQHARSGARPAGDSAPADGGAAQDGHHQSGGRIGSAAEALGRLRRLHAAMDAGTAWKPPEHSDPAASLEAVLATHAALGAGVDIAAEFVRRTAGSDPADGARPPRPLAPAGAPPGAGGGAVLP